MPGSPASSRFPRSLHHNAVSMEPVTLCSPSSSARFCLLHQLPSTPATAFSTSIAHPSRSSSSRSLRFSASGGAAGVGPQPREEPPNRAFHLALLAVLQSIGDFLLCRSLIARLCLWGGLQGGGIGGRDVVCCGGLGTLLLSTTAAAVSRARSSPFLRTLAANPTFVSGLVAWALAQTAKVFLNFFVERRWDLGMLFSCGGMPSSHAALCTALTASVALCHGVGDALFPVCLGFSLIVMYDATGVRRHAGMQAAVLNRIIEDLFQGHPISQTKLKELLGHTPSQVLAGGLLGALVACICCQGCMVVI